MGRTLGQLATLADRLQRLWSRTSLWRLALAAAASAIPGYLLVRLPPPREDPETWARSWLMACLAFAGILVLGCGGRLPSRRLAAAIVLAGSIGTQAAALTSVPATSTDAYHYVWDGRVQLAGISPYRYVPGDDRLAHLRDPVLFPGMRPDQHSGITTVWPLPQDEVAKRFANRHWTVLSRPGVPTIYPPVAQVWFAAIASLTPWSDGTAGVQLAAALLAVAVTVTLLWLTARLDLDPRWVVLWGWSPPVAIEVAANGHVDVLAALFVTLACAVAALGWRQRSQYGVGVLLGLAILTKVFPIVVVPSFVALRGLRRGEPATGWHGWRDTARVAAGLLGIMVLAYTPHVIAAGSRVIGYLPGYFVDQGYQDSGEGIRRFGVLASIGVPESSMYPVAAVIVAATALAAWRWSDPRAPWRSAVWVLGVAFLLATPSYPWYMLVLVPLIVLARRPEWMLVPVAAGAGYVLYPDIVTPPLIWTTAAAGIALVSLGRGAVKLRTGRLEQPGRAQREQNVPNSVSRGS